ncbi:MAG: DUF2834 domain-containing protein [Flavobacteriales bacterium]|nr:DUF2834 domain-containing protein [Flavobacteriales bacterium]MCX7649087.1 DUF2834 domain-containing protein [Flavobacteriales bacterium]MDW8431607.1 DUF2834 domain-containing protein [Flavobacteriales bacterium]
MKRRHLKYVYLLISLPGAVVPMYFNILTDWTFEKATPWQLIHAFPVLSSLVYDLLFAALAGVIFMGVEGGRLRMRRVWVYPVLAVIISIAFALPFFLFMRERHLERQPPA